MCELSILLSETDLWKAGKTCYPVKKFFEDTAIPYEDGMHVLYVNAEVDDGTAVAKLMQFFKTADPADMSQGELSEKVKRMKEGEDEAMYDAANEFIELGRKYGLQEGKQKGVEAVFKILNLFDEGKTATDIADAIGETEEFVTQTLVKAKKIKEWKAIAAPVIKAGADVIFAPILHSKMIGVSNIQ